MLKHAISIMNLAGCAALALAALPAQAQEYPSKPVRIIVGFTAGGGVDGNMRAVAQSMTKRLGQNFIVENRPGAGGNIGIQYTIGQPADGYTITLVSTAATIATAKPKPPYNIEKDLAPIVFFGDVALAFYVNPSLPVKNIQELIAYAKARPGKLSMASIGVGSTGHLAFEVFKNMHGIFIVHVPYKSTAETTRAVLSGEAEVGLDPFSSLGPLAEAGKLRVLAVASPKRHPVSPNVPAMEESGVRNYEFFTWTGLSAPAGTPAPVIQKLNGTLNEVLKEPEMKTRLERGGYQVRGGSPEEFGRYISKEVAIWRKVIAQGKFDFEQ